MKQNIKKILLAICVIPLFYGCGKNIEDGGKIAGTKWRSANAVTLANEFIYIHFIDNATFRYCYVDYDLNKLRDMKESSYIRTSNSTVQFSANDISLRSASFRSVAVGDNIITGTKTEPRMNLVLDNRNVECVKVKKTVKANKITVEDSETFEEKYLW